MLLIRALLHAICAASTQATALQHEATALQHEVCELRRQSSHSCEAAARLELALCSAHARVYHLQHIILHTHTPPLEARNSSTPPASRGAANTHQHQTSKGGGASSGAKRQRDEEEAGWVLEEARGGGEEEDELAIKVTPSYSLLVAQAAAQTENALLIEP
jgi:hypothetical protein